MAVTVALIMAGCSSYNVKPDIRAEERFKIAQKMFKSRDYFEAKNQFKIITLNNPGASFVDEAQYFLGECHFKMKEYILASDEFSRMTRLYPKSPWVDDAQFRIAYCDYQLSPKPSLDQTYTVKAVEDFQTFIEDFPESDLVPRAEKLLKICRTKLAQKEYKSGELYRKLGDHYGAFVYFSSVIDKYYDTKFAEPATYWKGECLFRLRRRRDSRQAFEELLRKHPRSEFATKAKGRLSEIDTLLAQELKARVNQSIDNQSNN